MTLREIRQTDIILKRFGEGKPSVDYPTYALNQLEYIAQLRITHDSILNDIGRRFIDNAILARYKDLKNLGYEDDAREILDNMRTTFALKTENF